MGINILSILSTRKVVGLYVGQDTVDLAVLKSSFAGPKLIKFGQTHIYPKETEKPGLDTQPAQVKTRDEYVLEAVKRVFRENNVKPGNVVTAISSEEVMVRYFQMPKIPKQEWNSAVNFEAKRYIPFRMEDVVSDFQVIPSKSNPNSMEVVFAAVKKNVIEEFVALLGKAGLRPVLIEPAPFSLMRALRAAEQISAKVNTAIVDVDSSTVNINILRNGVPYIIRDVPMSMSNRSGEQPLEPVFEKLLGEIKLSFDFYEKQFPNEVIDKIIIYSRIPLENWHEVAGKELQIPIEVGDPLRGIKFKKDMVPARAAISFGLALKGLSEPFVEVNLCKEKLLLYRKKEMFLRMVFLEASMAVLLLIMFKVFSMRAIAPLTKELGRTLSERPKVEVSVKSGEISDLEKVKNEMEARKALLEGITSNRTYMTLRMEDLVKLVPDKMWLTEVNFEEKADRKNPGKVSRVLGIKGYCIIDGKVSETDIVNNFLAKLKDSKGVFSGMGRADIVSVKKADIKDKKAASFEILLTGP
ncbi:MAG: pilus assembly protein PilM [Candidatus Omnitrophota bacterium]